MSWRNLLLLKWAFNYSYFIARLTVGRLQSSINIHMLIYFKYFRYTWQLLTNQWQVFVSLEKTVLLCIIYVGLAIHVTDCDTDEINTINYNGPLHWKSLPIFRTSVMIVAKNYGYYRAHTAFCRVDICAQRQR